MKNKYFKLYACCLISKGFSRSIIFDINRNTFHMIPNSLYEILNNHQGKTVFQINNFYNNKYENIIIEYFEFLEQNDYIFFCSKKELDYFPNIILDYHYPGEISNSILDLSSNSDYNALSAMIQLINLGCRHFQIRFFCDSSLENIESLLNPLEGENISSIEFILKFNGSIPIESYHKILAERPVIHSIILYSAPENKILDLHKSKMGNLILVKQILNDSSHCGAISEHTFSNNLKTFSESQTKNTCLNKKVGIDINGEIKNCPSMTKSYGNINNISVKEAIEKNGFKDVWNIHKDQIEVCKDCEFRHICTDCRVYIQDLNNIYSKPAKCSYNPYTGTWGDENLTNNPLYGQ